MRSEVCTVSSLYGDGGSASEGSACCAEDGESRDASEQSEDAEDDADDTERTCAGSEGEVRDEEPFECALVWDRELLPRSRAAPAKSSSLLCGISLMLWFATVRGIQGV